MTECTLEQQPELTLLFLTATTAAHPQHELQGPQDSTLEPVQSSGTFVQGTWKGCGLSLYIPFCVITEAKATLC